MKEKELLLQRQFGCDTKVKTPFLIFLKKMQAEPQLKNEVLAAATADDIARIALKLGYEFSGDELLRMSGKKFGKVTVVKNDLPGEYN